MKVAESLSSFLAAEPQDSVAKRALTKFLPGTTLAAMAAFALASMAVQWDIPILQASVLRILNATEYTSINPIDGLIASNILYIGERATMSIVEIMLKPLLDAQLRKGEAIGRAEGEAIGEAIGREEGRAEGEAAAEARFKEWKEQQMAQGVVFAEEEEEEE